MKKRAAIYARVSTGDQHLDTQLLDLREMAKQRGYEIAHEYTDLISGAKSKRFGLDQLMTDARRLVNESGGLKTPSMPQLGKEERVVPSIDSSNLLRES